MPKITFEKERIQVLVPMHANLREVAIANDIPIYSGFAKVANCKGNGRCGTCRVEIDGPVTLRNAVEEAKLKGLPNLRLACQVEIQGDLTVRTVSNALDQAKKLGFDVQGQSEPPGKTPS
jgi:ferredoxin